VISIDDVYGGTQRFFRRVATPTYNMRFSFVDFTKEGDLEAAFTADTKLVWCETPTNPGLKIADIEKVAALAHKHGALLVVDNTFASPYFQNPLLHGADIVMHSITKYINGHSDVVGGVVACNDDSVYERLKFMQNALGAVPAPFDCYMALRGMKTMHVRMREHAKNAQAVAEFLEGHPQVDKVLYPGLASHPQHEIAKKQMRGFSGMITFWLKGGLDESHRFLSALKLFVCAESLGAVESLAEHPAIMTHASVPAEQRAALGISDSMIRLSVGIEDLDDIMADLKQAFAAAETQ
jgi:cystathionine gamma-lyase